MKVYQQATTGKIHLRKNCSITRTTRYSHFERDLTEAEIEKFPKCAKCFDVETLPEMRPVSTVASNLEAALVALREQIAIAERSRPSSTAGPRGGVIAKAEQIERLRAKEEILLAKIEESSR